nr:uncharacterized protein LOC105343684 isoform X6 [Crassostrea gigas]
MVASGIVTSHANDRFSLPYPDSELKTNRPGATVLPILGAMLPKLEAVLPNNGPRGYGYHGPFLEWWGGYHKPEDIQIWINELLLPVFHLKPSSDFKLLDLGCGYGRYTLMIAKRYPNSTVYGIDPDRKSIDEANMQLQKEALSNVNFLCVPGEQLPQDWTENFNFVILNDVLHDAYAVDGILTEVRRVLKSDGFGAAYDPPVSSYSAKLTDTDIPQLYLPLSLFSCLPMSLSVLTARDTAWAGATKSGGRRSKNMTSVWSKSETWISMWSKKELSSKNDSSWFMFK